MISALSQSGADFVTWYLLRCPRWTRRIWKQDYLRPHQVPADLGPLNRGNIANASPSEGQSGREVGFQLRWRGIKQDNE